VLFCRAHDRLKHTIDVVQHLVVPKAKNEEAHCFENFGAGRVALTSAVLPSIDLDHEMNLLRAEIDNKATEWHLPPEFQARQAAVPESKPQLMFGIRLMMSKLSCLVDY
jgi:hypothetical protein